MHPFRHRERPSMPTVLPAPGDPIQGGRPHRCRRWRRLDGWRGGRSRCHYGRGLGFSARPHHALESVLESVSLSHGSSAFGLEVDPLYPALSARKPWVFVPAAPTPNSNPWTSAVLVGPASDVERAWCRASPRSYNLLPTSGKLNTFLLLKLRTWTEDRATRQDSSSQACQCSSIRGPSSRP